MDNNRFVELMDNKNRNIQILYNNHPAWVEAFSADSTLVQIKLLDLDENLVVDIKELEEEQLT